MGVLACLIGLFTGYLLWSRNSIDTTGPVITVSEELLEISVEIPVPDLVEMWGPGYSIPSDEGNEAIAMMMKLEGIVLDTCYTGKAFAGLVRRAREGFYKPEDHVLFIHTGGTPLFFDAADRIL